MAKFYVDGKKIKNAREQAEFTLGQLAERAGTSSSVISHLEQSGRRGVCYEPEKVTGLSEALDVEVEELVVGVEDAYAELLRRDLVPGHPGARTSLMEWVEARLDDGTIYPGQRGETVPEKLPESADLGAVYWWFWNSAVKAIAETMEEKEPEPDLKTWREMIGVTQKRVAEPAGVNVKTVKRAENGEAAKKAVRKIREALRTLEAEATEEKLLEKAGDSGGMLSRDDLGFFEKHKNLIYGFAWSHARKYGAGMNPHDLWDLVQEGVTVGFPYAMATFDPEKANSKDTPREARLKRTWGKMNDVIEAESKRRRRERERTVSTAAMSWKSGEEAEVLGEDAAGERFSTWGQ